MIHLWGQEVSNETCMAIGEFSIMWAQFETCFFQKNYSYGSVNGGSISLEENELNQMRLLLNEIKEILLNNQNQAHSSSVIERFLIRKKERKYYMEPIKRFLDGSCESVDDMICAGIYICARIRNNCLHGEKELDSLNDQIDIFRCLTALLQFLIERNALVVEGKS